MNSAIVLFALTCLAGVNILPVYGQDTCCENCCDDGCDAPTPYNITLEEYIETQPLYVSFYVQLPMFAGIDSACYTYIPLPDGTYLLTVSRNYATAGFNTNQNFITTEAEPGVFPAGSASCNQEFTIFDYLEDCDIYLAYLCFYNGVCTAPAGNVTPILGFTSEYTPISEECLATAVEAISRAGIDTQEYITVPMTEDPLCVTEIDCTIPAV